MTQLLTLPDNTTQFDAGGVTYYVEDKLSIARYRMFQKFQREIATGLTHFDLIQLLKNNVSNLNKAMRGEEVLAQMSYENINALNHSGNLEEKEPFEVWLCTLIMNTRDEDRRKFDVPTMQAKIRNWEEAGIDIDFFTSIAESLCGLPPGSLRSPILTYLEPNESLRINSDDETYPEYGPMIDPNTSLINNGNPTPTGPNY